MLKNYIRIAWRNLIKNRVSSFINIAGLAMGMAVAVIIGLWIYDELSFNTWHKNYDRIAQVKAHLESNGQITTTPSQPMPLAATLRSAYGNDFKYVVMSAQTEQHVLSNGDKRFMEPGNYMQPEAPDMLTLNMLEGSREGLKEPNSILLSASTARKLFGNAEPLDKIVKIDTQSLVKVTGVYEDLPGNSEFSGIAFITPFDLYLSSYDWAQKKYTDWNNICVNIYTQLNPNVDREKLSAALKDVLAAHISKSADKPPVLFLQPMSQWHLYSKYENGKIVMSEQLKYIWLYGTIGMFVLLLACINFMNLSTAHSEKRAKEVGIRKAMGSLRLQLTIQFFSESVVIACFAFILAIFLAYLSIPWFNEVAGRHIRIPWSNAWFWLAGLAFILLTSLLAGSYPALYLSSFNPVTALKGSFRVGRLAAIPRQALVVLQFTISIVLFIATITIYRQVMYAKDRSVGYSRENLVQMVINAPEYQGKYEILRSELKATGVVTEVAESASPATGIWSTNKGFTRLDNEDLAKTDFATIAVTPEYGKTIGWQFVRGRDFSRDFPSDYSGFVINESAAKLLNFQNPVGEYLQWDQITDSAHRAFKILGVVKDMVMQSPFEPAFPTIFFVYQRDAMNCLFMRLNPATDPGNAIARIGKVCKKLAPTTPFECSFVNEDFDRKFAAEEQTGKLAGIFASLAIFISCLGLFGLSSFVAEQRTKEIGIRKVLGASAFTIWRQLCKDFLLLVLISLLIASPVAYYFTSVWLDNYQYRTDVAWWVFALAGFSAIFVTLLTVSYQSINAAIANPVKSLRTE